MDFPSPLKPAKLIKRYKRFLADMEFADGTVETVHCPNPGTMIGLAEPGFRTWVSQSTNLKRKLKHTWEVVEADDTLVGINTNLPNKLLEEAIKAGGINALQGYSKLCREVKYGQNSRIDILLEQPDRPACFVEIKNVHLCRQPGLAEFPDCVTARGAKHLRELTDMVAQGHRAVMVFLVQRNDCTAFAPAADIDPTYAHELAAARKSGVEVLCYDCEVSLDKITVQKPLDVS